MSVSFFTSFLLVAVMLYIRSLSLHISEGFTSILGCQLTRLSGVLWPNCVDELYFSTLTLSSILLFSCIVELYSSYVIERSLRFMSKQRHHAKRYLFLAKTCSYESNFVKTHEHSIGCLVVSAKAL